MSELWHWTGGAGDLLEEARRGLERLAAMGARRAEVYRKRSATVRLHHRPDAGEAVVRSLEEGIALRVEWEDGRIGFAAGSDPRDGAVEALATRLLREAGTGSPLDLPGEAEANAARSGSAEEPAEAMVPGDSLPALKALTRGLIGALGAGERSAVEARRLQLNAGWVEVALANSAGFTGAYARPLCYVAIEAVARRSPEGRGALLLRAAPRPGDLDPGLLAERVARRAAASLGGEPAPAGEVAAVVDADAAADLLQEVVRDWAGPGPPRPGDEVAAPGVSVVDDGRLSGGPLAAPFDGEGTPTRLTVVVEQGQLVSRLHDRASARREGVAPTGNGVRHSFRDPPAAAPTHLAILPGKQSVEDLLAELGRGLYVTHLRAVGSRPGGGLAALVEGVWVERGRAAGAVSRALMVVPRRELLRRIRGVAGDLHYHPAGGAVGSPTLLLDPVTLNI